MKLLEEDEMAAALGSRFSYKQTMEVLKIG
jgi:hypothetical protein